MTRKQMEVDAERAIPKAAIASILAAGHLITVDDGEDLCLKWSNDADKIFAAMFSTDEDYLHIHNLGTTRENTRKAFGWIRFVYGNDGWDVMSDYTTNLESLLADANKAADEWEKKINA